jgi:hypothetical protein
MIETPADAEQAAYFRVSLDAERQQLLGGILKRRPLLERRADAARLHSAIHRAEAEVRYLDHLIERLDCRFASQWRDRD